MEFSFSEIDSDLSFNALGIIIGGSEKNNVISIDEQKGSGLIRKINFQKGLHIRAWDFKLSESFDFNHVKGEDHLPGTAFSIIYILSPGSIVISGDAASNPVALQGSNNILLVSDSAELSFHIQPHRQVRALDITVSRAWMLNEFDNNDPVVQAFMDQLTNRHKPVIHVEEGNATVFQTATELHQHAVAGDKGNLYLKAKTLSLISDFFSKNTIEENDMPSHEAAPHRDKMLMVEAFIAQHFEKELPSLEAIAKEVALSESTLKRHFKMMFGKSIYEYYLEKKMEYAKQLLLEKTLSVREVASRLGYEKTSNFIHMFKRFHNYSPGYLKKA